MAAPSLWRVRQHLPHSVGNGAAGSHRFAVPLQEGGQLAGIQRTGVRGRYGDEAGGQRRGASYICPKSLSASTPVSTVTG